MKRTTWSNLPNPGPTEAATMPPLELHTILFRRNYEERNTTDRYWYRLHRHFARQAIRELRHLTGRPAKRRNVPCTYGQPGMKERHPAIDVGPVPPSLLQ